MLHSVTSLCRRWQPSQRISKLKMSHRVSWNLKLPSSSENPFSLCHPHPLQRTDLGLPTKEYGDAGQDRVWESQQETPGDLIERPGKLIPFPASSSHPSQTHMAVEGGPVIEKYLQGVSKELGFEVSLDSFTRWTLGQTHTD